MSAHTERLLRLYNRLRRGPVTIDIITKWAKTAGLQISERQLYRDLNQLKSLQIAEGENVIEYTDEKNRKTWKLEYQEASEKITQYDINSFFLLKNFAPYAILEERRDSIEKLEKIIYKGSSKNKYQQLVEGNELYLRRTNYFVQMYGAIEHQQIEDLVWAVHNKRAVIIESITINPANIHFNDLSFPIKIYPLELVFHIGRVYLSGVSPVTNQVLIFAIDKHLKYVLTNERFNRKKYWNDYYQKVSSFFGISDPKDNKVYNIKIEFTKGFGISWMNYFWHHTQRWTQLENGNYMMHMRCSLGRELYGFLAYGLDKIKVHQPKALRDLFLKKMENVVAIHQLDLPINEEEANKDY
jgi:predicted DNA-binding transcriptional regulator YafY